MRTLAFLSLCQLVLLLQLWHPLLQSSSALYVSRPSSLSSIGSCLDYYTCYEDLYHVALDVLLPIVSDCDFCGGLQMLGEQLYPLVDQLEHDYAGKVTGMLLEMDQTEVLHLIESPDALKSKVHEAMEVLRMAQAVPTVPTDQLGNLAINEST